MHRTILGIEGTAWNLSAGKGDRNRRHRRGDRNISSGTCGIHPLEAAQHHAAHIASVIRQAIESAGDTPIDGIAFSQGPGMGPCLRTVATAARALALSLDVPRIGINHCVANSQVLAYRGGRYRIFGETLDKFARHAGFSHPGGPNDEFNQVG